MTELLLPGLVGISAGFVSGFIPGIGNFAALLVIFPYLYTLDPVQVLVLYVALTTISQYIGSIPAISYGIPGESSSIPAVIESKNLKNSKQTYQAIVQSAIGSTFGGLIVLAFTWLFVDHLMLVMNFFDTKMQLILYVFMFAVMTVIVKSNSFVVNVLMIVFGLALGMIGYNKWLQTAILTFDQPQLYGGIPFVIVMIVLLGIPEIIKNFDVKQEYKPLRSEKVKIKFNVLSSVWYSVVGFIGGLAPGMTTTMSSQLAYLISKVKSKNPIDRITASETANNAGAFSQLIPLMLLGIPLIGSEALVLNVMEAKGFNLGLVSFPETFKTVSVSLLVINAIGLILAWPLAKHISKLFMINLKIVYAVIFVALISVVAWVGYSNYQLGFYMLTFLALLPVAVMLRRFDTMPLVFAFLVHDRIFELIFRSMHLFT